MDLIFGSPLFSASATHSSEYPLPLKIILWWSVRYSLIRLCTAVSKSSAFSRTSHASANASATIVFSTTFDPAMESREPTIRNSNLFLVNANGEVLFLSVASFVRSGRVVTPVCSFPPFRLCVASPVLRSCSTTSWSCSPRKIEMIAGGASFAPSLWSFPGSAADSRSRSACTSTAFRIHASTRRNCTFSWGVFPGSSILIPSSVVIDQLLCLPDPLTPANGFSCSRHFSPCSHATFFSVFMIIWLWSTAILASA